jgi:hypothetical protein
MIELNILHGPALKSLHGHFDLQVQDATVGQDGLGNVREGENQVRVSNGGASSLHISILVDDEKPVGGCVAFDRTLRVNAHFGIRNGGRIVVIAKDEAGLEIDRLEARYALQRIVGPTYCA